jgi:putative phosphoesterase
MLAGVISDTHGLLRPEAVTALRGVDCVIHAGDIGSPEVLRELARIAPVHAIRGNNDRASWAASLPDTLRLDLAGLAIFVIHDVEELVRAQLDASIGVVISGHSHAPKVHEAQGVLYLNPGSAGPRRFRLPVTVAQLEIQHGKAAAQIVDLPPERNRQDRRSARPCQGE